MKQCALWRPEVPMELKGLDMGNVYIERFVRVPQQLLETLLPVRLSGLEWRVLLWVLRNTLGWNRRLTLFSWYAIAQELKANRAAVLRAGRRLIQTGILFKDGRCLGAVIAEDGATSDAARQRSSPSSGAPRHRNRRQAASLFRRVKDSSKENNIWAHSAGAARPIPGKYDRLEE